MRFFADCYTFDMVWFARYVWLLLILVGFDDLVFDLDWFMDVTWFDSFVFVLGFDVCHLVLFRIVLLF